MPSNPNYSKLEKFITNNNVLFEYSHTVVKMREIWFELFNETITLKQSCGKISHLKRRGFELKYKSTKFETLTKYLLNNEIVFEYRDSRKEIKNIWFKLFNETITLKQSHSKINNLKRKGYILKCKNDNYSILSKYILENKVILDHGSIGKQIKEIWFKLFNETITFEQGRQKVNYLKTKGFKFIYKEGNYIKLIKYILDNNIVFQYGRSNKQIKEIWFKLFKETITLRQSNSKILKLKKKGLEFKYINDVYSIFIEYITMNNIEFEHQKTRHQIKEIWFKLFNETLTIKESRSKFKNLRRRGIQFNYKKNKTLILEAYLLDNKIQFEYRKIKNKIKEIWFELFNESITSEECVSKIGILRKRGFKFKYTNDNYSILTKHLLKNKIVFQYRNAGQQIKEIWFKLFNEKITSTQSRIKINNLKNRGFKFIFERDTCLILKDYLIENDITFQNRNRIEKIKEIWFKLFNETITSIQSSTKINNLTNKGFKFKYEDCKYTILKEYLIKNEIIFHYRKTKFIIKEIWFKLFNETISLEQSNAKIASLKKIGYKFIYKKDFYIKLIKHLKKNDIWIEESKEGYLYLQDIWKNLFHEKITLIESQSLFIKISSLSPQSVNRKVMTNYVSYKEISKLKENELKECANIFAIFCRNNNIIISEDINEGQLSRIWSVCFAENK